MAQKSKKVASETLSLYKDMLLIRRFEEKAGQLYGMGLIGGFCHLYIGQEALVVGTASACKKEDKHNELITIASNYKELTGIIKYLMDKDQNTINKINRTLNIDIESFIEFEKVFSPKTIEKNTQSYLGSLYGSSSNNKMSAFLRHPNFSKHIQNLYFCGGRVHPGGVIPLCLLSAKIVSELIKKQ